MPRCPGILDANGDKPIPCRAHWLWDYDMEMFVTMNNGRQLTTEPTTVKTRGASLGTLTFHQCPFCGVVVGIEGTGHNNDAGVYIHPAFGTTDWTAENVQEHYDGD